MQCFVEHEASRIGVLVLYDVIKGSGVDFRHRVFSRCPQSTAEHCDAHLAARCGRLLALPIAFKCLCPCVQRAMCKLMVFGS